MVYLTGPSGNMGFNNMDELKAYWLSHVSSDLSGLSQPGAVWDPDQTGGVPPNLGTGGPATPPVSSLPPTTPPPQQFLPMPFTQDPNQPLSTPQTPVNQATAPTDISSLIPGTSQQQNDIITNAITQSQGLAGQNFDQLKGVINPWIEEQIKSITDPQGSKYQAMMGELNNMGVANGGAFPQALADKIAPLISQGQKDLGMGTMLPSFLNQQDLVSKGAGIQSNLGLEPLSRFIDLQNWGMNKDLANQLADKGASAQLGGGLGGLLGGGLGAWGGSALGGPAGMTIGAMLGSGAGKGVGAGLSWICTHLKNLGLATEEEVENVHKRLRPTIFRHPIHWLHYLYSAPLLIVLADAAGMDWKETKKVLVDQVIQEHDSELAWTIYRNECQRLCEKYAPHLWALEVVCH